MEEAYEEYLKEQNEASKAKDNNKNPNTEDNIITYLLGGSISLLIIGLLLKRFKKINYN